MLKNADFENLFWDFLLTYRQFLLHGYLHKRVHNDAYQKTPETWNTLLLSLESSIVLGLAKILEEGYFGRDFENDDLNRIANRITNIRKSFVAHNDLSKMRNKASFLEQNQLNGTDLINIIDALKSRAIAYQQAQNAQIQVQALFTATTQSAMHDLDAWLKSFAEPL